MIDESTDVSVIGHVVVFATCVEEYIPIVVFLNLFQIPGGKKMHKLSMIVC